MARFMQLSVVHNSPFWLYNLLIFFSLFVANKPESYFWEFNILKRQKKPQTRRIPILHGEQN